MDISPKIDHSLMLLLNSDLGNFVDNVMVVASYKLFTLPLIIYALYTFHKKFGLKPMLISILIIALMVAFADQTSQFFKHNLSRLRPTHEPLIKEQLHTVGGYFGGLYGTVSAHAANSVAILGFCSLFVKKRWFTLLSLLLSILICYSRIYLGVHYPLDILWGTILGVITALLGSLFFSRYLVNKRDAYLH